MTRLLALIACSVALGAPPELAKAAAPQSTMDVPRVEARSADMLAVGLVRADRMIIHLSRPIDNAPVHDASVAVALRGALYPATAEADGSYSLSSKELALPGATALEFQITEGGRREVLKGELNVAGAPPERDKSSARQLGWWVLNFAVCIGFLLLISRRKKAAES